MDLTSKLSNLKNQLLDLAIRGKLVEQRPEEGTSEELYAQIQKEKKKLIAEGKIKKEKTLPEITEDEIPFEIPESWKWVRLGDIVSYGGAKQSLPKELNQDSWILDLEDIESSTGMLLRRKTNINVSSNKFCFFKGNILYGKMRPYLNKVLVADSDGFCSTEIMPLDFEQFKLHTYFFKSVLMSPYFVEFATKVSHGVNIPRLGTQEAKNALVPLPPLAEQKRIVDKLESYLAEINKAEALIFRRENLNEQIREKILDLAIKGKLVEQRPEEGTAEELYTQIQEEKKKLIVEGKIKKEKSLPEITEDEIPFEIPESWKWVALGNICEKLSDGIHYAPNYTKAGIPCFSAKDIYDSMVHLDCCNYISEEDYLLMKDKINVKCNSILITKSGSIGRSAIISKYFNFGLVESIGVVNPIFVFSDYLKLLLDNLFFTGENSEYTRGLGLKHLTLNLLGSIKVPLPPLAEQKRIVAKIEELLPYCEKLK
ncbi:restriction endonuclease subunit S [Succinivibrio dextrinosolvens]|uniref:restriction endonuclease subunit S n=1 Tax=Succinivibrio dextrinosolvens TaxID=83771 RepID=UPI0019224CA9|nr:restriction endonuclease subunit S [Succinivibrio dextrinosolvens]